MNSFNKEILEGQRFEFGQNWLRFQKSLTDKRIQEAEKSLRSMLELETLANKSFLDIGSGSGLFSLAARRMGAKVCSFDYDPSSVECTQKLRQEYYSDDKQWVVSQGSVLDDEFLSSLGKFDIVYSWGVLHHTGSMWKGLSNLSQLVAPGGFVFIALYNDQGVFSRFWRLIKKSYCKNSFAKFLICSFFFPYFFSRMALSSIIHRKNQFSAYADGRGMAVLYDWIDWLGGYPFEVAKVEDVFEFFKAKKFELTKLITTNSHGNNEFVFRKK